MKHTVNHAVATLFSAVFLLGMSSCSKEIDNGIGSGADGTSAVQFTIKNNKGNLVTYAIAENDQWTVGSYDVYAFSGDNLVGSGKMQAGTDYTLSTVGGTTTITATPTWLGTVAGETVNFYFVGNDATSTGGAHITSVPTSEATFKELLTNTVPDTDNDGYYDNIEPLLLFSAVVPDVALTGKVQKDVVLTRRDARFDIKNELYESFQIDEIYISNANIQANIFGTATGANTPAQGSHETVDCSALTYDASTFLATSVFHIYPTTLGKAADGNTEIMIKATMGGQTENYTIKNNLEILPNHRYILVLDPLSLTFTVTVADYEEGGEIETEIGGEASFGSFTITPTVTNAANWNAATQVYKFDDNDADELSITVESQYGSSYKTTYVLGDESAITNYQVTRTRTTTYSGFTVKDVYTIKVPQNSDAGKAFSIKLDIYSPGGEAKETLTFVKGEMTDADLKDVVNGNEELADAVKEAIKAATGKGENDPITPDDLDKVTSLDVSGANGASSLDGIENLPNLKEINAAGNSNITEVDLSGNPELEKVILDESGITELDCTNNKELTELSLVNCPDLEWLELDNPKLKILSVTNSKIASFEGSGVPNLTEAAFNESPELKTVDVSMNQYLERLWIKDVPELETLSVPDVKILFNINAPKLTTLNLPEVFTSLQSTQLVAINVASVVINAPTLTILNIDQAKTQNLDISSCESLGTGSFLARNLVNPMTVKVWPSFDISNPVSNFPSHWNYNIENSDITYIK